nr:hypothetical protein [Tanacetum cinerariifolium]
MSSFNQRECLGCGQPCDGFYCYLCTCWQCGMNLINEICLNCTYGDGKPVTCCWCEVPLNNGFCWFCDSRAGSSFSYDPNPNSFDDSQNLSDYPPQAQYETYSCELCENDSHYGYDCPPRFPLRTIPLRDIIFQLPPSIVITTSLLVLPTEDPEDSLIIGNEDLSTIFEKESDEFIKSSVEDLVPIPSESEDTSGSDSECILPSYDDFSPINVFEEKSLTFSNPFFKSNDGFTSSDDESLSDEDVPKDNIYSNPLFEFDDEYISSNVNPLFDEVLENIENNDSYDYNLDEPDLLVTPIFDVNEDECFDPGDHVDEINDFEDGYYDSEGDILYLESLLSDDTTPNLPPEVFLDHDLRSLSDAPIDDLMIEDKVFDPGIHDQNFSLTYVSLPFENRHYLFFTFVV